MVQYRIDAVSLWVAGRRVRLVSKRSGLWLKSGQLSLSRYYACSHSAVQVASNKSLGNFHMSLAGEPQLNHHRRSGQLKSETKPTISAVNRRENLCVYFLA